MCLPNCKACQYLIENVSVTSTRHLGVRLLLENAVKNDPDEPNIISLRRLKDSYALERREAVDQYRIHLLGHETKTPAIAAMAA